MSFRRLLNLKGIHPWYLASAIALNIFWTLAVGLLVSVMFLNKVEASSGTLQLVLLIATFLGPFLIGWIIGKMAGDGRGPTYGVYGSLGSIAILFFTALPSGLVGVMLVFAAVAGGLNGGLFSTQGRLRD